MYIFLIPIKEICFEFLFLRVEREVGALFKG